MAPAVQRTLKSRGRAEQQQPQRLQQQPQQIYTHPAAALVATSNTRHVTLPASDVEPKLVNARWQFTTEHASKVLLDNSSDFTVVGVLGRQGAGKSMLLNLLLDLPPGGGGGFLMRTAEHCMQGRHCTTGIDMQVHSRDRTIALDCQPLHSLALLGDLAASESALMTTLPGLGQELVQRLAGDARSQGMAALPLESVAHLQTMQVASFLLAVCHVVVVLLSDADDMATLDVLQAASLAARSLPDVSLPPTALAQAAAAAQQAAGQAGGGSSGSGASALAQQLPHHVADVVVALVPPQSSSSSSACNVGPSSFAKLQQDHALLCQLLQGTGIMTSTAHVDVLRELNAPPLHTACRSAERLNFYALPPLPMPLPVASTSSTAGPTGSSAIGTHGRTDGTSSRSWFSGITDSPSSLEPSVQYSPAAAPSPSPGLALPPAVSPEWLRLRDLLLSFPRRPFARLNANEREWLRGAERIWAALQASDSVVAEVCLRLQRTWFQGGGGWILAGRAA